jgi:hypothetical protein
MEKSPKNLREKNNTILSFDKKVQDKGVNNAVF